MAFERPLRIMEALQSIDRNEYALPALQREFVWKPEQICDLFDSLMKGYPIGSFLFWKLDPEANQPFRFYQFMRDYHERTHPFCDEFPSKTKGPEIAVLDGQQRLTGLYIAVYGSYAQKKKYVRRDNPLAYPEKHLYLNLLFDPSPSGQDENYDFRFLTSREAEKRDDETFWFKVGALKDLKKLHQCITFLNQSELRPHLFSRAIEMLTRLHELLYVDGIISYYLEHDQNLDKVLHIFIRVNSGGTQLGYADLLLSIATTQWKKIDSRQTINAMVTTMNSYGAEEHFNFSRDLVLKACLVLTARSDVRFSAANFTAENMQLIEDTWPSIENALHLTAQLLDDFGFGRRHIRSASITLVIASYLHTKGYDQHFLDRAAHHGERAEIKRWFIQMNLSNLWSGNFANKFLSRVPQVFAQSNTFDCAKLLDLSRRFGGDPYLDSESIEDLLEITYNDKRAFLILSLLFDSIQAHTARPEVDHIYPRTLTKASKLVSKGLSPEAAKRIEDDANRLPNLWLLSRTTNQEKGGKMPLEWLGSLNTDTRTALTQFHYLQELTPNITSFETFYDARKERLRALLLSLLGRPGVTSTVLPEISEATVGLAEPSVPIVLPGTNWSEDILGMLDETYHPLAHVLMAAGIPEPTDIDKGLTKDGLTTSQSSIMNWAHLSPHVLLLEPHVAPGGLCAHVVTLSDDLEHTARQLKQHLSS